MAILTEAGLTAILAELDAVCAALRELAVSEHPWAECDEDRPKTGLWQLYSHACVAFERVAMVRHYAFPPRPDIY